MRKEREQRETEQDERVEEAMALMEEGDLEEALEITRQLLADDDQRFDYWCLEGKIRALLQEDQAAERAFDRACALQPGLAEPLLHKAQFFLDTARYEEAIHTLQRALQYTEDRTDQRDIYYMWSEAEIQLGREELVNFMESMEGGEDAEEMLEEEEGNPPPFTLPPEIREQLERGLAMTQKAIDLDDNLADLWHLRGGCLMDLERPDEAIAAYQEAVNREPYRSDFLHDLGLACEVAERHDDARAAYRKLFDLETSQPPEGMDFSRQEFSRFAQEAWQDIESNLSDMLEEPLPPFEIITLDFPSLEQLESAEATNPFNPWVPMHIEFLPPQGDDDPHIRCIFYQRNVEREAATDDPHEMHHYLRNLLEGLLFNLGSFEDADPLQA